MKHLHFPLFFLLFLLSCQPKILPTIQEVNNEVVLLKLSHQSTKTEMEDFAGKVEVYGFVVDFSASEFFENDKLRNLKLYVKCPDGKAGRTNADLTKLQFNYFGFRYQKNANPVFKIGSF